MNLQHRIESLSKELASVKRKLSVVERDRAVASKEYITASEAERRFGISQSTIRRNRNMGRLTDFTVSRSGRIYKYAVDQLEKVFNSKL